ncbi:response regulator [Scytonema sp. PRP1]|uniref:response regulator n=1 Tax=Scytonema sp. PRP1 TaxID=3120513 RepID=UPI002FD1B885
MRILLVEDDELMIKPLTTLLKYQNYVVEVATDGQIAWDLVEAFNYDLILLDIVLPKIDGITLCRRLRSQGFKTPILLLTGQNSSNNKAIGLDAGADDYVVKPFCSEELTARIRSLLRRCSSAPLPVLEWGSLRLDLSRIQVHYETHPIQLTSKEYALLELLMRHPQQVFSCDAILEHIWSFKNTPTEEAVRTQIKGLRQKLKTVGADPNLIETVYGVGYRLKAQQAKPSNNLSSETENKQQQQTVSPLAASQNRLRERINQYISVLEQAATAYLQDTLTQELRTLAEQKAHTLATLLCNFGLNKGSQLARTIDYYLKLSQSSETKEAKHFHKLVLALRKEIECSRERFVSKSASHKDDPPKLLIVDSDCKLTRELVIKSQTQGIVAEVATNLSEAREKIYRTRPNVVLLDLVVGNTTQESLALLAELLLQNPPVPFLVFTAKNNLDDRIQIARLGGRTFLQKPIPAHEVLQTVMQVLLPIDIKTEANVMVADNNSQFSATLSSLLEPWGIKVSNLGDPQNFWQTLEVTAPDLLIINLEMPDLKAIELCQVVRNDMRWGGLPILLLTDRLDANTIHQAFAAGADDCASKSMVGRELVTCILHRLKRINLQRNLGEIDPLTRLYNRHRATEDLNKLLRLCLRHNQPMCLLILDLNNFNQVNNSFDPATDNAILRQLGQLLQQLFREEDVVSRWDKQEFVVGMYGMTRDHAHQRLVQVLEFLDKQEFSAIDNSKFRVTASAGLAQFPEDGSDLQSLYKSAKGLLKNKLPNKKAC